MKKIFLLMSFLLGAVFVHAQINQGTMLIGGNIGLTTNAYKTERNNTMRDDGRSVSLSVNPQFGIFVVDNFALGAGIGLRSSSYKEDDSDYKSSSTGISITPFARYYIKNFFVHGQFDLGARSWKTEWNNSTSDGKDTFTGLNLGVGYAIFLNERVAIEPMAGYKRDAEKEEGDDRTYIDTGMYIKLGIQVYLRR